VNTWVRRLGGIAKVQLARLRGQPLTDEYVAGAPSPQHALDLFAGEWSSRFPATDDGSLRAGPVPLFEDRRLEWAIGRMGGVAGRAVLELGPLEAGHTWMLEQRGAAGIVAIEANRRAYLKCLVVKEVLGMVRARFLLGDFVAFLREHPDARFDVGIASGVLYHMRDPVDLLGRLSRACHRIYLWTHYYDPAEVAGRPVAARFGIAERRIVDGFEHTLHPHWYQAARFDRRFCGSGETHPRWMTRDGILAALRHFGYTRLDVGFDEPGHANGPAFAVVAEREDPPARVESGDRSARTTDRLP
jgi:hypothetical protein